MFLEVKLVGFDLNLIVPQTVSLLLDSTHSILGYPQWLTVRENNNLRKGAKTESEAGHFMDSKENKIIIL